MTGPCLCGDTECLSCGAAMGTLTGEPLTGISNGYWWVSHTADQDTDPPIIARVNGGNTSIDGEHWATRDAAEAYRFLAPVEPYVPLATPTSNPLDGLWWAHNTDTGGLELVEVSSFCGVEEKTATALHGGTRHYTDYQGTWEFYERVTPPRRISWQITRIR